MAEQYGGVYIGICTGTHDPEGSGRVQVHFPSLGVGNQWARVGTPSKLDVNSDVVVGFENGDLRRPIVLGLLKSR